MSADVEIIVGAIGITIVLIILLFLRISHQLRENVKNSVKDSMLQSVSDLYNSLSSLKEEYGRITGTLSSLSEISNDTKTLKSYLTSTKVRGKWGERLVEDIINLIGLQENVNYKRQSGKDGYRPDFTFFLPNGKIVNLDSKFSLDNYIKYIEANNETDKESFKKAFLQDVRKTIKDVSERNYINEDTIDLMIVFIASESVYSFIMSEDPKIIDEALKNKVVLTSPLNLYAMLSIIRKASEYYALERSAKDVLGLLSKFKKEWQTYLTEFDKMRKSIDNLNEGFNKLSTTRKSRLDSILSEIEEKSSQEDLEEAAKTIKENDSQNQQEKLV